MSGWIQSEVKKADDEGKKLGSAGQSVINTVGDIGQAIINNPLPVIETVALTAALGPETAALTPALGATNAAAVTAATASAAVTAANGGDVKQIATAAATAGVGSEVASAAGPALGPSPISGAATGSVNPLASAAGGAAAGATKAAITGEDIAKGAATGGLISGAASAGAQGISSALSSPYGTSGQVNIPMKMTPDGYLVPAPSQSTIGEIIPTGGPGFKYTPPSLGEYDTPTTIRAGEDGTSAIPAYQYGSNLLNPSNLGQANYAAPEYNPVELPTPGLSPDAQSALQTVLGYGIGTALAPKPSFSFGVPTDLGASTSAKTGSTSSTTGGGPGGTELDPSTGKAPQLVWGDEYKSLKEGLNV